MTRLQKSTLIPLLFLSTVVLGQKAKVMNDPNHDEKPVHFGFTLGLNFMNYQISQSEMAIDSNFFVGLKEIKPGINIQAIANLRLGKYFDLRCLPGISFGERQLYFFNDKNELMYEGRPYQTESSFLELPLLIKYKAERLNNFRPYLLAGANVRYDLAIKKEYDYKEQLIMFTPIDYYGEIGGGFDFYLTYFKLGIELKYSQGLRNVFRDSNPKGERPTQFPEFSGIIDQMRSSMFIISFHFE